MKVKWLINAVVMGCSGSVFANTGPIISGPDVSVVLDGFYQDGQRAFSHRDEGFGLGHTELGLTGSVDDKFRGVLTGIFESHHGSTEIELEEAFIETLALPAGLKIKAGRFLSEFGYLNSKHTHEDAFTERPGVYRALLGSHYFDDGIQVSALLPTEFYLAVSAEAFSGKKMDAGFDDPATVGVVAGKIETGSDIGDSNSWMLGLSVLRNGNGHMQFGEHDHDHSEHEHGGHDHSSHDHGEHNHGPAYTGRMLYGADLTWKWAPQGNYKYQNLRFTAEYLYLDDLYDERFSSLDGAPSSLSGFYGAFVYQFNPNWSVSSRYSQFDHMSNHDVHGHGDHAHGHFVDEQLKEIDFAIAWHSSHFGVVRAQVSQQDYLDKRDNIVSLQYIMTFGAHGAHAF
ncbi:MULTISPECIES: hypothetical protein [unclassified Motilimonas]|uniref:hypothetical protein n=1 Tax=unclassified Motilimonas TaxID=2643697 RepID=UPI001E3F191B|nr:MULTISPECIES: hypothetical protein [unclassified Motilimonas]MCE0558838.1 hypothetical protein [Motilimonas sp. E26]MDO6526549.1 hypothetical protein [Motilimonas sp. 1_MG-2023]